MVEKQAKFISLRWRITVPLFALTLIVVMVGIYVLVSSTGIVFSDSTANILQQSQHEVLQRSADLHEEQRRIARTLALLSGVPEAVQSGSADTVRSALETRANNAGLDLLALTDDRGRLVLGLLRGQDSGTFARISVLDTPSLLEPAGEATDWTGLVHIANVSFVTTAAPISQAGVQIGHVFAGQRLSTVIETFKPSAMTDAVVYTQEGSPTATTLNLGLAGLSSLSTAASPLQIEGQYYQALDFPFSYGDSTLGTFRLLVPDNSRQSAIVARQLGSLLLTLLAAVVVIALFVSSHWSLGRTERIQRTAESLARGEYRSRTHLRPVDEIGRAGQALDQYADSVQQHQDALHSSLRRQRRENERLTAVLESLPDGVIVQDLEGRVLLLNEKARELLGSTRVLRSNTDLNELMARVSHRIGPALAPGLFALGDAQRIQIDQRMLSVQAAAVMTVTRQHLGTVIVVRDISEEVELETARKRVIEDLSSEVQEPLTSLIQAAKQRPAQDFSREIQQHSSTLQRMILELRDLSDAKPGKQTDQQRPILLDSLVWAIANEWRQVAQAQNLTFHVMIEKPGLYVLGQERRLRWAIGNIIDNAIKYTLPGGDLTLEIQDDDSEDYAHLRVRDNGVGITREELPHVTTRFFRGRPVTPDGQAIRVPGSGQGLFTANQIIEAHGGSMEVRSKLAVGTAVYFSLPLTAEQVYELPHFSTQFEGETLPLDVDDKKSDS